MIFDAVLFVTVSFCGELCDPPVGMHLRWFRWCGINLHTMLDSSLFPTPLVFESAVHISVFGKRSRFWLPLSREVWRAA